MEERKHTTNGREGKGLALAGLIIGLTGLLCALMYGWRIFAIVISVVALIVSVISLRKARRAGNTTGRQMVGILSSVVAILLAAFFLINGPPEKHPLEGDKIPAKINEKGLPGSEDKNLEELRGIIDSNKTE